MTGRHPSRRRMSCRRSEAGFTLVETLVATTVLAIVVFSFLTVLTASIRANADAWVTTAAANIAEEKLEWVQGADWDDPDLAIGTHTDGPFDATGNADTNGIFDREWVVNDGPLPDTKDVQITVTDSRNRTVELRTIVPKE